MPLADTDHGLTALVTVPETLTLAGVTLTLTPLVMRDLPGFQRVIKPIVAALQGVDMKEGLDFASVQGALLENLDATLEAVAIMSKADRPWLEGLAVDDFITLTARALRINADFFMTRILPTLNRELEDLVATLSARGTGSRLPPDLSAPGTATAS